MLNILRTSYGHLTDTFNTFYNISLWELTTEEFGVKLILKTENPKIDFKDSAQGIIDQD